jgi:uncharacterized RDD family membrane protein YckC
MNETALRENPYTAPQSAIADEAPRGLELAGRGARVLATVLDSVSGAIALLPLAWMFLLQFDPTGANWNLRIALCALPVLVLLAWNGVLLSRRGQTLGKQLLGIRVLRVDGSHCGLARIFFARFLPVTLLGAIPLIGLLVSLVDALMLLRDSRRCLHDEIADTIVVTA